MLLPTIKPVKCDCCGKEGEMLINISYSSTWRLPYGWYEVVQQNMLRKRKSYESSGCGDLNLVDNGENTGLSNVEGHYCSKECVLK